jgi:hypothetical protein
MKQSINQSKKNVTTTSKHPPGVNEGIILIGATP